MGAAFGIEIGSTLGVVGVALAGVALGSCSGLVPGLHANNFALLLAAAAPSIPADPLLVGVAMLTAGVVHTFLDIVPALTLGVPDAAMAVSALPGHRLVIGTASGIASATASALPTADSRRASRFRWRCRSRG